LLLPAIYNIVFLSLYIYISYSLNLSPSLLDGNYISYFLKKFSTYYFYYPNFTLPVKCCIINESFVLFYFTATYNFASKVIIKFLKLLISLSLSCKTIECFC